MLRTFEVFDNENGEWFFVETTRHHVAGPFDSDGAAKTAVLRDYPHAKVKISRMGPEEHATIRRSCDDKRL